MYALATVCLVAALAASVSANPFNKKAPPPKEGDRRGGPPPQDRGPEDPELNAEVEAMHEWYCTVAPGSAPCILHKAHTTHVGEDGRPDEGLMKTLPPPKEGRGQANAMHELYCEDAAHKDGKICQNWEPFVEPDL